MSKVSRLLIIFGVCAALLLSACGGGSDEDSATGSDTTETSDNSQTDDDATADDSAGDDAATDDSADDDAADNSSADTEDSTDTTEPAADEAVVDPDSAVNVYLYQAPVAWNPLLSAHGPDQQVMNLIFQKLIIVNESFDFESRLAESWDISEDATTFTFTLFDGLTWNDGEPLTAADLKFTFDLLADPAVSANSGKFAAVVGFDAVTAGETTDVTGFQAVDDLTFVIELTEPNVGFLATVSSQSMFALPQHILAEIPREDLPDAGYFREPTVTYGPYNFESYDVDQAVELTANADYHLGAPAIQRISLKQLTSDVAAAQLGTGEIDLAFISATDLEAVQDFDDVEIVAAQGTGFIRMGINHDDPRLQDPRVRQAMLIAINRQGLVDTVLAGYGEVLDVGYHSKWALPDDLDDYAYDPERAKALLAEAGWDSDEPVEIQWIAGTRDRDAIVPIIQQQWNEVGINTETVTVEVAVLLEKAENHEYDLTLFGGGNYSADPNSLYAVMTCDHLWMGDGWCSEPGVNELLETWRTADATADPAARQELYYEISRTLNEMVPYISIYNSSTIWANNTRLQGFKANGDFVEGFFNAHEWTLAD